MQYNMLKLKVIRQNLLCLVTETFGTFMTQKNTVGDITVEDDQGLSGTPKYDCNESDRTLCVL